LGALQVWIRYGSGEDEVWVRYSYGADKVWIGYGYGMDMRYRCGMDMVRIKYGLPLLVFSAKAP